MSHDEALKKMLAAGRKMAVQGQAGDEDLGPFAQLPGKWINPPGEPASGFNMISLPFAQPDGPLDYRLLLNRYTETLTFDLVDKAVANRGILRGDSSLTETDQFVVTLDYMQAIAQEAAADFPESGMAGKSGQGIHREPGLWLHMKNQFSDGIDIARLSTIPHGDSMLALGSTRVIDGPPSIPAVNGLVEGGPDDLEHPYMSPYKHFVDNPFEGFDPLHPHTVLEKANENVDIVRTTELSVDTRISTGGISNLPFIKSQANATYLQSWFWIQELADTDQHGQPKMRLQYLQVVNLDFFPRPDGSGLLLGWPHISINTLVKE